MNELKEWRMKYESIKTRHSLDIKKLEELIVKLRKELEEHQRCKDYQV